MKRFRLTGAFCVLVCVLSLFFAVGAKKEESVKEIAKPYIGTYSCERILFGGEERTEEFSRLSVELKANGTFTLSATDKRGRKYSGGGEYVYDRESDEISFFSPIPYALSGGKMYLERGALRLVSRYDDKLLLIFFKR